MNDLFQLQEKYFPTKTQEQMASGPASSSVSDSSLSTPSSSFSPPQSNSSCPASSASQPQPSTSMPPPSSTSAAAGPIRRRRFSTAKIQPTRIKKVMQADEEIGRMVASVPVAIGRAMEHFAEKFLQAAALATTSVNSRTVTPVHMKNAMLSNPHFHFLAPVFKEVGLPGKPGGGVGVTTPTGTPPVQFDPSEMSLGAHLQMAAQNQATYGGGIPGAPASVVPPISPLSSPATPTTPSSFVTSAMSQMHLPFHPLLPGHLPMALQSNAALPPTQSPNGSADTAAALSTMLAPPVPVDVPSSKRTNGKRELPEGEKPKRGRPRKIKKDERCLDEELCKEVTNGIEKEDKDRALMPPPALPMGLGRTNAKPVA